jgi:hypothetical protein
VRHPLAVLVAKPGGARIGVPDQALDVLKWHVLLKQIR